MLIVYWIVLDFENSGAGSTSDLPGHYLTQVYFI